MKISAKLGFAFLVAVVSPLIIGFVYHHNLDRLSTTRQWVEHTYQVLGRLDSLSESISRLEGCARGFCVAADPSFLSDYNTYKVKPLVELDEIRKLTADNPTQTSYCAELAPIIDKKISFNDSVIESRRKDFQSSANLIQQKTGLKLREDIDHLIQKMKFEEQRLLNTRTTSAIQLVELTEKSSLYGSMAAVLLIGVIGYLVARAISSKITALQQNAIQVGQGNFAVRTILPGKDEINVLADAFNEMTSKLQAQDAAARQENWIKDRFTDLTAKLQQYRTLESL
ncbi:MAG TPA: CHASE3 domain-containing protein, partial [Candidatus Obscuribacter sp.]|nr:CHASE3 domain-containing protein [Candidatus Obscuribacter sp.]